MGPDRPLHLHCGGSGSSLPFTRALNYDWQSFGRFLKIEKSHPPEARQRVSACRSSGWQAANKSFARIGQTNRSRLNQVASVDPTESLNAASLVTA